MSQSDDQTLETTDEQETNDQPTEQEEFDFTVDEDRLSLYEKLDAANKERKDAAEAEGFINSVEEAAGDEDEGGEEPSEEDAPAETVTKPERTGESKEPKLGEKVLSREEFEELFRDVKIKTKIAGEEVEAPVSEFVKATGLEKHWTKRLQELSRREREILQNRQSTDEETGAGPSEEEIEEKYNELYEDSPYKAKKYLDEVEKFKESSQSKKGEARVQKAVDDFKSVYPECTEEEWGKMNDPAFWQAHEDIVKLKENGDVFATLVTAYTRLQTSNVKAQAIDAANKKPPVDKTERKKKGQVLRTNIKPTSPPKGKAKGFQLEPAKDYIAALRNQARARMGINDD